MKRVKKVMGLLVVLAISILRVQGASDAGEMIGNGDFEFGMSGWDPWHDNGPGAVGVVYSTSTDVRPGSTGNNSLQIDTTGEFTYGNWIRQAVRGIEGGKKYRISIWYKVVSGGDPDGPIGSVVARDRKNDTNQDRKDLTFDMTTDGTWKYITDEFTADPSTTPEDFYRMMVHLYLRGEGGKGGTIRVDDFSLSEIESKAVDKKQETSYAKETQTINANLASQADKWGEAPQNSVLCMQTYAPLATMTFDVIVPEPGGTYKVSVSLIKVTNGAYLRVYIDNELQTEIDTYVPANVRETILVCDRFITAGKHTIKIENAGQKKATGGNHLSVIGLEIVCQKGSGTWRVEEKEVFAFTPLKKEDASGYANLLLTDLPPRLQKEPFSIPEGSDAANIFSYPLVSVNNIPFRIPNVNDVPETGLLIEEQNPLEVGLPNTAREFFLLIWSKIPLVDADAGPSLPPIAPINQSERFTAEIVYEDGTTEQVIPFNVVKKSYGLDNGLSLYVLHPGPGKVPQRLVFHDKVYKCSFALVALTCNPDKPISPEPGPEETCAWYSAVDKKFPAVTKKIESKVAEDSASVSDGIIAAEVGLTNGVQWNHLGSPVYGEVTLDKSPVFAVRQTDNWVGSEKWKVVSRKASGKEIFVNLEYKEGDINLKGSVKLSLTGDGKIKVGLTLVNEGTQPFLGRVRFPIMEGLRLGSLPDTWYFLPETGRAMIHHTETNVYSSHGAGHPLQVDSFFNPKEWYALTLLSNDLEGQFHWYDVGKSEEGGWYRIEYLEKLLKPGAVWSFPDCIITISPGDWRESFRLYRDWVSTWYKPKPPVQDWYKNSFFIGTWYVYSGLDHLIAGAQKVRDIFGYYDAMALYGWHAREHKDNPTHQPEYSGDPGYFHRQEYSGEYDRDALFPVGGEENFRSIINNANQAGIPISLYTNAILINKEAYHFGAKSDEWGFGYRPVDYGNMMGYVPCLSIKEWIDYMVDSEKFLAQDLGAKIIYLDQFGGGSSICYRKDHPHESPEPHFYGERELTKRIRAAIPDDVVICSEAQPEDTRFQFQNSYYQGGILSKFTGGIIVPMNMTRFAFPDTKCFNNIYNYPLKDNNWEFLKFILFSGDSFFTPRAYDPESYFGKEATQDFRKMFRILHENADTFTSFDVEPLLPTLIPGVFVNRFKGDKKVIWTVFNANYRTAKGKLVEVTHKPGSKYVDLWNDCPVGAQTSGDVASIMVEIGPRDIACISQVWGGK